MAMYMVYQSPHCGSLRCMYVAGLPGDHEAIYRRCSWNRSAEKGGGGLAGGCKRLAKPKSRIGEDRQNLRSFEYVVFFGDVTQISMVPKLRKSQQA